MLTIRIVTMKQWTLTEVSSFPSSSFLTYWRSLTLTSGQPYLNIKGGLLEGPHYDEQTGEARFIDITGKLLYVFKPAKGPQSLKVVTTEDSIG